MLKLLFFKKVNDSRFFFSLEKRTNLQSQFFCICCHFANQLVVAKDAVTSHERIMIDAFPTHFKPIWRGKIDSLGQVVTLIETSMVSSWECDNKFPCVLIGSINGNTVSLKDIGIHSGHNVVKQVGLSAKEFLGRLTHNLFSLFGVFRGYTIPKR